jgi:hypothetical protein
MISDEVVEIALRAWQDAPPGQTSGFRAALEAVAPMIRAEALKSAAKMIEKKHTNNVGMIHPIARSDAADIRAIAKS